MVKPPKIPLVRGNNRIMIFALLLFSAMCLYAQRTVAIVDFENRTDQFYMDAWSQRIPEFLRTELSKSGDLILLERQRLSAILEEQKLSMTGLTKDSTNALKIGEMLSAQYLITGSFYKMGSKVRIDASIVHVASGKVISEKVECKDASAMDQMVQMLGQNLRYQLTGRGQYKKRTVIAKYPVRPFLYSTLALAAASAITHSAYEEKHKAYQDATGLQDFDSKYNSATQYYRARNVLVSLTAAGAVTTLYCWLKNISPNEILASDQIMMPYASVNEKGETLVGFHLSF